MSVHTFCLNFLTQSWRTHLVEIVYHLFAWLSKEKSVRVVKIKFNFLKN